MTKFKTTKASIAITGGGTGGHLKIAKVVKDELVKQNIPVIYIGSQQGQDKKWFEHNSGFDTCYFLQSQGVVNKKYLAKLVSLYNIFRSAFSLYSVFKKHKITALLSVGGYSAAPAVIAAIMLRVPLFIHEQNSTIGTLNRYSRPFAKAFFSSFDSLSECKSYPIETLFFQQARIRKETKTILFLGGSLGASAINNLALNLAKELIDKGFKIIHQCGATDFIRVKSFYEEAQLDVEFFDFSTSLHTYIFKADFAISRAGASTLFELSANALPTLFIPYPHAAKDHQFYNARFLQEQDMAYLLREDALTVEEVHSLIKKNHHKMSEKLHQLPQNSGVSCIIEKLLKQSSSK
jgi:UDP-N-acetylglucosamine--N-acetylmuramyl-(pentapeptide) pyrophosphoryl-undecaprenol N-acetylglucosamine transferase